MSLVRRVLVVEDEPALSDLLLEFFQDLGLQAVAAEDGAGALAHLAKERPDIISVDNRLPDMSGLELIDRFKAEESTRRIPLLFISGDARHMEAEALKRGADVVVSKPLSMAALKNAVEKCLGPL